ncbi:MAG: hypothetical protein IT336_02920 [Thermomicrobiales bacterium]|nr:hypothetical protein [Thermomicrobiales bacterium]
MNTPPTWHDNDDEFETLAPVEVTVADLASPRSDLPRENRALEPVKTSLELAGFYAYGTFDEQQRWSIAVDDELGRVGVRIGPDGFVIEMWATSPGLFAEEENDWRRRAHERLARMTIPNVARGMLAEHQTAYWDEVEQGVCVRVQYELPFTRAQQVGAFVREHLPELESLLTIVESQIVS